MKTLNEFVEIVRKSTKNPSKSQNPKKLERHKQRLYIRYVALQVAGALKKKGIEPVFYLLPFEQSNSVYISYKENGKKQKIRISDHDNNCEIGINECFDKQRDYLCRKFDIYIENYFWFDMLKLEYIYTTLNFL